MRKLIAHLETGFAGSKAHVAVTFDDDTSENEINEIVYGMALDHAESYGYYPYPDDDEDFDEDLDEEYEGYTQGIEGYYEEYDPKKHDMLRAGGGSFENDF